MIYSLNNIGWQVVTALATAVTWKQKEHLRWLQGDFADNTLFIRTSHTAHRKEHFMDIVGVHIITDNKLSLPCLRPPNRYNDRSYATRIQGIPSTFTNKRTNLTVNKIKCNFC